MVYVCATCCTFPVCARCSRSVSVRVIWLHVLLTKYYSGDQIKKNEMGGARSTYGERRDAYKILVGKPEGQKTPGRPRRRWGDDIKMDLNEMERLGMDWCGLE